MKHFIKAIFMLAMVPVHRIIAALDFPKPINDFITYSRGIHDSMKKAPYFGSSAAKLATLDTDNTKLQAMETGLKTNPPSNTVADRNVALTTVQNDLRGLQADVQTAADAAGPDNAEAVIIAAGMKVKKLATHGKQTFKAEDGPTSGTVKLIAAGIEGHAAHNWAKSLDGTNWDPITPTTAAHTIVPALAKGSILDFRHQPITPDGPGDWEEIMGWVVR